MPFVEEILKHRSLSIVGMEKNTGKTECLNYVLKRLKSFDARLALTSIGIDGEGLDQVTATHKPEIELYENIVFVTSEKHFKQKKIDAEILNVGDRYTSLGRLVTARSVSTGKLMFSGPTDTVWLRKVVNEMPQYGVDTTIVDGALSRLSLGSPAVTESLILATGAALSANINTLVSKTKYVYTLINLEKFSSIFVEQLLQKESGIWAIDKNEVIDLDIPSVFLLEKYKDKLFMHGNILYVAGAITDKILNFLRIQKNIKDITLVVKDFTKIFAGRESFNAYIAKGGKIEVLLRTKLIAVCVNPTSPEGYVLNSADLRAQLAESLKMPVYDIKQI